MLAVVDFSDPLLWAVFIGWIMSVVPHEFAHGIVAHWGGDWTIKERGGLTLNPLQYIDPFTSLLLPAVIFLVGGVPLPGGVTYVRRDLIRTRAWNVATSAAGPAMNFILFLLLALPMHPAIGWIEASPLALLGAGGAEVSNAQLVLATMAWLQMLSVLFNLIPVPPLDGFQIVAEFMDEQTRRKFMQAGVAMFLLLFMVVWNVPALAQAFHGGVRNTMMVLGFDQGTIAFFGLSYNRVLFGSGK